MDEQDSQVLIDRLMEHATQSQFIFAHRWQTGDLVLWDNRSVIHRGCAWDMAHYKRTMMHTSVRRAS